MSHLRRQDVAAVRRRLRAAVLRRAGDVMVERMTAGDFHASNVSTAVHAAHDEFEVLMRGLGPLVVLTRRELGA